MTTITLQVPENAKDKLCEIVKELGGKIIFITADKAHMKKTSF